MGLFRTGGRPERSRENPVADAHLTVSEIGEECVVPPSPPWLPGWIVQFGLPLHGSASHSRGVSLGGPSRLLLFAVFPVLSHGLISGEPVVPAFDLLHGDPEGKAAAGELLLGELNCLSCHEQQGDTPVVATKRAPDLSAVGVRVTPGYLRRFLLENHEVKPGTTMPDLFHGTAAGDRQAEVESLVHFLVSQGGGIQSSGRGGSARLVERGRDLYHSVGCVSCHEPEMPIEGPGASAIPLGELAAKTTVDHLTAFLLDPLKIRRSGRMPRLWLSENEAHALAVYLLRDQLKNQSGLKTKAEPGVRWEYFEAPLGDRLPDFETLTATKSGTHGTITFNMGFQKRRQDFAMRWRAILKVPKDGKWTFFTVSDDGSQVLLNGEPVVDSDGVHTRKEVSGSVELKAGEHELDVRYFQKTDSAIFGVGWQGPDVPKQRIPSWNLFLPRGNPMSPVGYETMVIDQQKVAGGAKIFVNRGCASCHSLPGRESSPGANPFADLVPDRGCLSANVPANAPDYNLSQVQRSALKEALALREERREPLTAGQIVQKHLASFNCYACHQRGGLGGPDDSRRGFFGTKMEIDLGEEGKIPPNLDTAGSKFRKEALERILYHGEMHVRGRFMSTRMPGFGKENLEPLVAAFLEADARPDDARAVEFNYGSARDGQALVGTGGLVCITCHNVGGRQAVGIPGIDLAEMQQRLTPGWFVRFLHNPQAFNRDTRMPAFWPGGVASFKKIAGGDTNRQVEGIWNYLSLGKSMPPPPGIAEEGGRGSELKPLLEPVVHRTFMTDVGPRAIVAGFPERVHVAFDANVTRLAKTWRGRFFDSSGVASGRSDKFFSPLGTDIYNFPAGPAFAFLETPAAPWPSVGKTDRDVGGEFRGYRLTSNGEPVFQYQLGGCLIQEQPKPVLQPGGAVLQRHFKLRAGKDFVRKGLTFIAATGQAIEKRDDGSWTVDKKVSLWIEGNQEMQPSVREGSGGLELMVPLSLAPGDQLEFNIRIKW